MFLQMTEAIILIVPNFKVRHFLGTTIKEISSPGHKRNLKVST